MKIRGTTELVDALNDEIAWRKHEITNVRFLIQGARRAHEKSMLMRAAIALLYAHWEGFAKRAGEYYLQLVAKQGLRYDQLKSNFVALGSKNAIREAGQSSQMQLYVNVVEFATFNQANIAKFAYDGAIDTQDNLNSRVLTNLLTTVGLTCDDFFTTRFLLLDGSLLKSRNAIAQGERLDIEETAYDQLHTLVIELTDFFKTEIENAAVQRSYRR